MKKFTAGNLEIDGSRPFLIAGPCVIEGYDRVPGSYDRTLEIGLAAKEICERVGIPYLFKASFDKANRSSATSYRGPGLRRGLEILAKIKDELKVPVVSDVHDAAQVPAAAEVLDVIQIPAFLCRQTDLLVAAAKSGKPVNVKKGQFLAPEDMGNVVEKVMSAGAPQVLLTERGSSFGYHNLVVDMRSFPTMKSFGVPVVFDATHSVQLPGGNGATTGGQREFIPTLARAAAAAGADGYFMEVHDKPEEGLSDSTNMLPLSQLEALLRDILAIDSVIRERNGKR